ncbi:hypothetical protein [Pollutimonas bauzanensis]|uniref:ParB-like nuclease domain-containing protein n=1 Tax=Pollutimonas bauzanensis TaxID=658167 RepID=A0A1M5PN25_9BURK|nr:hypothetical protein [Pollutimonas bauzanensis]SHH03140.1 hypothetical protein SAMN04488135_1022 [Pollutimonas bauzanensis]SHH34406.1 hypothetical protein SAMN04488135_1032 [Pollutimonas bauzanensis]
MASVTVLVSKLDFDLENPRYIAQKSQREAFERILLDNPTKTIALAEHIVNNGQNPIDLIAVIATENNRYIVLEGNRRAAVLKALNKPVLLDAIPLGTGVPAFCKKMKLLAKRADKSTINKVGAVQFDSREDADIWIPLKHTGENEGAGTVPWDGTQRARFRKGDAGLNLLDFGKANDWFTEEDLTDRAAFPISTLNRLLGDPAIRKALGLELSAGKLQSTVAISDLEKGIKQVVSDLATGTWNVSMLKSKQDRKKYLDQFPAASLPSLPDEETLWPLDPDLAPAPESKPAATEPKVRSRNDKRSTLIPKSFVVTTSSESPRLNKIYRELKRLSVEDYENAVAVLLRTFIELSLDDFIARDNVTIVKARHQATLAEKVRSTAKHLKDQGKFDKNQEGIVNKLASTEPDDQAQPTSITTLHSFVHSRYASPLGSELKTIWDNISPFMLHIAHV